MPVEINSNQMAQFWESIEASLSEMKESVFQRLAYIGEASVKKAREMGNYQDRTANLRSSIGYMIVMDGEVVTQSTPVQAGSGSTDGSEGIAQGTALLNKLKGELPSKGAVLVVCAGMQYAWYVENVHHKDVLASAELEAERLVKKMFNT